MIPRVLFVAAEAIPLAKTGGLGDVVTALARGLHDRGIEATVLMPGYPQALDMTRGLRPIATLDDLPGGPLQLLHGTMPDSEVPVVLVRNDALFGRAGGPYQDTEGHQFTDNAVRFGVLCHAAARVALGESRLSTPACQSCACKTSGVLSRDSPSATRAAAWHSTPKRTALSVN